jgi:hypothetical protein
MDISYRVQVPNTLYSREYYTLVLVSSPAPSRRTGNAGWNTPKKYIVRLHLRNDIGEAPIAMAFRPWLSVVMLALAETFAKDKV